MRCPSCGAHNPDGATWCTQCFAATTRGTGVGGTAGAGAPDAPHDAADRDDRDVRVVGDDVEWRCTVCDAWQALEVAVCRVCGTPRQGFGTAPPRAARTLSAATAVGASVVLPGLAHALAGQPGAGVARGLLAIGWTVLGAVLLAAGTGPVGALLLVSGLGVWVVTVWDARLLTGVPGRASLAPRRLAWTVVAVSALVVVAVAVEALRAT